MTTLKNENQYEAKKLYTEMIKYFEGTYPEYYGGAFIDKNDNLNALVIDGKQEMAVVLEAMGIILKPCRFTYNELNEIMDQINSFMITHPGSMLLENLLSAYLLEEQNIIIVELIEYSQEYIEMFQMLISSSEAIRFIEARSALMDTGEIDCGSLIESSKPSSMSICCRAKKNSFKGFITVGHSIPSLEPGENIVYSDKKPVAVCTQKQNSGIADAAFCEIIDPEFVVTNKIAKSELELDTETSDAIVGETVNMTGLISSASSGRVNSTNLSVFIRGNFFYNLVRADYKSKPGDSGGIVYTYNPEKNKCFTVGVHKGFFTTEGISIYSKATNVLQTLEAIRY